MKMKHLVPYLGLTAAALSFAPSTRAHCDTMEGPVVAAARSAFAKGDVTPVLKWVKSDDEGEIRSAFNRALRARGSSREATELAETWFFETLVRIHRAGEGAPYTGLKSGAQLEPGVAVADDAIESGKSDKLLNETVVPLQTALQQKFERVSALRAHADHDVAAGREYVAAYVDYVHFAERLAALGASPSPAHEAHGH